MKKICIVGISGKLGQYRAQRALDRGSEITGVCREHSTSKLERFKGRITIFPGPSGDWEVIKQAVEGGDEVLTVLVPWGVHNYASGTAQAVLDHSPANGRQKFSSDWHITRDDLDVDSWRVKALVSIAGWIGRHLQAVDTADQVEACRNVFARQTRWTVVRCGDYEGRFRSGPPGLEQACIRRTHRQQHDAPGGHCADHSGRHRERQLHPRSPRHRWVPTPSAIRAGAA